MKYSDKSPLKYPGGKSRLAKSIIRVMPPHRVYVEPFAGAAHVLFAKPPAEKEVINDIDKELMQFFKDVKGKKICCDLKKLSYPEYKKIIDKPTKSPCDVIRLNKASWGGNWKGTGYGPKSFQKSKGTKCFDGERLANVQVRSEDFRKTIEKFDSKDTLFYVDPPYVKANSNDCIYGEGHCDVSPHDVAKTLNTIKGKALVSYDDDPQVRKAFKGWKCQKIRVDWTMNKKKGTELICKNFK